VKIQIGNSVCLATGFTRIQYGQLRKLMSYVLPPKTRRQRKFGGQRKHLFEKNGEFPTGLLYLLEDFAVENGISIEWEDTRIKPPLRQLGLDTMLKPSDKEPYPEQREAGEAAPACERGIVVAPTGVGKSYMAGLMLDALQVPSLVVVPSLGLKIQLTEELGKLFGEDMVGPLDYRNRKQHFITVENVDGLPLKPIPGIDAVFIDEFHHSGAATYRKLNTKAWDSIYYKFGLTATPFRSQSEEKLLLESVLSKVIYQIPYSVAVAKKYIVPLEAYVVELPLRPMVCKGKLWHAVYAERIVNNEERNEIITNMAENLYNAGKSTLILVKQIPHGEMLRDMLAARGCDVPFAEGKNEGNDALLKAFNRQDIPMMIGTVGIMGEGRDTKPCEYVVMAGGGKSRNQTMQNIGRGFRKFPGKDSCKVVMFKDDSHKWLKEHHKACLKTLLEEYGAVPAKLDL
jgi:superfamily II DNA or RNA helicase